MTIKALDSVQVTTSLSLQPELPNRIAFGIEEGVNVVSM